MTLDIFSILPAHDSGEKAGTGAAAQVSKRLFSNCCKKKNSLQSAEMPTEFLFCFGALEASQERDVVKSSAATACLFHTKHNSGCIFIGKLGPTRGDERTEPGLLRGHHRAQRGPACTRRCPAKVFPLPCQTQEEQRVGKGEKKQLCSYHGPYSSVSGWSRGRSRPRLRRLEGISGVAFCISRFVLRQQKGPSSPSHNRSPLGINSPRCCHLGDSSGDALIYP